MEWRFQGSIRVDDMVKAIGCGTPQPFHGPRFDKTL
jgi:hypothetical protein